MATSLFEAVLEDEIKYRRAYQKELSNIEKIQKFVETTDGIIVIDFSIPLPELVNNICQEIWVVESDCENRVNRVMERSGYTREKTKKVIKIQDQKYNYNKYASEIILNNGDLEKLKEIVIDLLKKFSINTRRG